MLKETLVFTCEVKVERNGLEVPIIKSKGRTKTIRLFAFQPGSNERQESSNTKPQEGDQENDEPVIRICNPNTSQGQLEVLFSLNIGRIKKIITNFVKEGKLTIVINEGAENPLINTRFLSSDLSLKETLNTEVYTNIFFSKATVQMLEQFNIQVFELLKKRTMQKVGLTVMKQNNNLTGPQILNRGIPQTRQPITEGKSFSNRNVIQNKINRDILVAAERVPSRPNGNIPVKRVYEPGPETKNEPLINIKKLKLSENENKTRMTKRNLLGALPEYLIFKVFSYVNRDCNLISLSLINKELNKVYWCSIRKLDFERKPEVPMEIFVKFLSLGSNIKEIRFGRLKYFNQKVFLDNVEPCQKLVKIDFRNLSALTDAVLKKFYLKCKSLKTLTLNYFSKITDSSLETISAYLKNVEKLKLVSEQDTHEQNKILSETAISKAIRNNLENLISFKLHTASSILFNRLDFLTEENCKITTFHIENFIVKERGDVTQCLKVLSKLKKLKKIRLTHILTFSGNLYNRMPNISSPEVIAAFNALFNSCPGISHIEFGHWSDNHILSIIANNCPSLSKLYLKSECLDDAGLELVFQKCLKLSRLSLLDCPRVNGHCFEVPIFELKKLEVSFDDCKLECLKRVLSSFSPSVEIKNVLSRKKYR